MHLHSCIVSFDRPALTRQTLESFLATVTIPYSLIIVDNGSNASTTEWLSSLDVPVMLLGHNFYPGYATNRGWEQMPLETTLLQRIDNDTLFLSDWCEEMIEAFQDPSVGQYGLAAAGDEPWTSMPSWTVGGNSIIRRELYDQGLRYSEESWESGQAEDCLLTWAVWNMGYRRVFSQRPAISYLLNDDPTYRERTHRVRGLL